MDTARFIVLALVTGLGAAPVAAQQPATASVAAPPAIAIVGADLLPMTGVERVRDQTVIVAGDRIVAVGPRQSVRIPAGARVIEASGQVLTPGLVDMHVHVAPTPGDPGDPAQRAAAVMLAHGVTTMRGMAGSPANLIARGRIEAGTLPGPRFYAASPALNDANTKSPAEGVAQVDSAKAAGFDLIKSHELSDIPTWQAIEDEAHKLGLPTAGHVNKNVGLTRALTEHEEVEHLDGAIPELLPEGSPERNQDFGQLPPPIVIAAAANATDAQIAALAQRVAAARSWQVPTLALFEKITDLDTPTQQLLAGPDMRYVPDQVLQQWAAQREDLPNSGLTAEAAQKFRDLRRRIVRAFHAAGVPIMAGSDTAQAFHLWGPALYAEIEALSRAGLTPMEALRAATVVPRDYFRSLPNGGSALGWKAQFGTIEPGARADLDLWRGDPAQDLSVLRGRPNLVIAGGRPYDRAQLDAMLARAAVDAKAARPPAPPPPAASSGPPRAAAATGRASATLGPCDGHGLPADAQCGIVRVPENRSAPARRMIDVHFAVLPALGPATDDPLVVLPGGPGLGGVQSGGGIAQLFADMRKDRDILLIDQRGTGQSNPLVCPQAPSDSNPLGELGGFRASDVIQCRKKLEGHADLRYYFTREAVRDMETVRSTLGYSRLDLFGMSYGTRVALDYLRLYPDRVGQTVIRAAAPPEMLLPLWGSRDTQTSFDRMAEECSAQPDCAARHPDLKGDLAAIISAIDRSPAQIRVKDPATGKTIEGALDRDGFGQVMFAMLYIPQSYAQLPPLLAKARAGDLSPLVQAAAPFVFGVGGEIAWGMYWSVICDEDVSRIDRKLIPRATAGTFMGRSPIDHELTACANWPHSPVPAAYLQPVKSKKPVFIISGYNDPVAGKVWGDAIARTLPNSVQVEVPGAAHLPPLPGCTGALMEKFLGGASLQSLDVSCVAKSPLPHFAA
ncbi:MAG: alpha/beta fold hydrolase [Sphingomicrobium sp.]